MNSAAFKGFAIGECLFLCGTGFQPVMSGTVHRRDTGATGGGDWEIAYRFAATPNVTGLVISDITGIAKKGWEYLWVRYTDTEDAATKALVKRPITVYVEQVYPYGDLNQLGI